MSVRKKVPADWHPADIKAALEKAGWSFAAIGREMGYAPKSVDSVLRRPMGPVEQRVAEILGVPVEELWPSRYVVPLRRLGRWHAKHRRQPRTGPADRRSKTRPHNADRRISRAA